MKYAIADCKHAVDAVANVFTFLGYRIGCQQTYTGGITESYRCQRCTNTCIASDQ